MKLIRLMCLATAMLLPTAWSVARAGDEMKDGAGDMKKGKKGKGDMGSDKGDMGKKKGEMEKK